VQISQMHLMPMGTKLPDGDGDDGSPPNVNTCAGSPMPPERARGLDDSGGTPPRVLGRGSDCDSDAVPLPAPPRRGEGAPFVRPACMRSAWL
jgi:hypothetical protein